ncbi:hypothetical protein FB384_002709 [Prauserella sediminis]|uniref:Uncharacterized protein n=1 Tax=Prauserella sediminis TaxID=577680 RepID=A0A839XVG6_9PSEU|nr:hypothetical protein [Prauserella sediminis]
MDTTPLSIHPCARSVTAALADSAIGSAVSTRLPARELAGTADRFGSER